MTIHASDACVCEPSALLKPLRPSDADSADGAVRCWVTMRNVSDSQKAEA